MSYFGLISTFITVAPQALSTCKLKSSNCRQFGESFSIIYFSYFPLFSLSGIPVISILEILMVPPIFLFFSFPFNFALLSKSQFYFSTLPLNFFISNLIVFLSCFMDLASPLTSLKLLNNSFVFQFLPACLVSISPNLVFSFGMVIWLSH